MPTVTYSFNTEYGHDDLYRLKQVQEAEKYHSVLMDISTYLDRRCREEYGKPPTSWQALRKIFLEMLDENELQRGDF